MNEANWIRSLRTVWRLTYVLTESPCVGVLVARFGTWRGSTAQCRRRSLVAPKINLSAALFELGKYCRRVPCPSLPPRVPPRVLLLSPDSDPEGGVVFAP